MNGYTGMSLFFAAAPKLQMVVPKAEWVNKNDREIMKNLAKLVLLYQQLAPMKGEHGYNTDWKNGRAFSSQGILRRLEKSEF